MPKYITYGNYDDDQNSYTDNTEKEVSSADILRGNEDAAANNTPEKDGFYKKSTANAANDKETSPAGSTAASILSQVKGAKGKSKGGGFAKKFAPLAFIIGLIGAGTVGIGLSQVLMPFHVIESLTEMTDASFTARQARMPNLVRWLFNMESETKYTKLGATGKLKYNANIKNSRVQKRLAAEGIDVDTDGGVTVLKYQQADGTVRTVGADEYAELWRSDPEFRNKMNRGGRSFLGRIAAHIDLTLANFLNSHNLTKNLFKKWINKVYEAEGQTARLHDVIEAKKSSRLGDVDTGKGQSDIDKDGKITKITPDEDSDGIIKPKAETDVDLKGKYSQMLANAASLTTSAVCGAAAIASAMTAAKMVIAFSNARGAFSAWGEGVDKAKSAEGNESPINAIANDMIARDENGLTALQSEQMKWAISGGNYSPNRNAKDVVDNSLSAIMKDADGLFGGVTTSVKWIIGCAVANVATAAISIEASIATAGTFSFGKFILSAAAGATIAVGVGKLAEMLVKNAKSDFCLDKVGVARGACVYLGASNYNGTNFQNGGGTLATRDKADSFYDSYKIALADEAELIRDTKSPFDLSSSHTFLGSIASKFSMMAIEMPNTFGMLSGLVNVAATSLSGLLPTASALEKTSFFDNQLRDDCPNLDFGNFTALGDMNCEAWYITDQSMNKTDPNKTFETLRDYHLKNGGESMFELDENGEVKVDEKTGQEIINPKSKLAKYISYCAYRSSPFGNVDQNIMNAEASVIKPDSSSSIAGEIKNFWANLINSTPIGDIFQGIEGVRQIDVIGWSTGANCVARDTSVDKQIDGMAVDAGDGAIETTMAVDLESWNDFMRYAQAYVADDRYMQTAVDNYVSPVQEYAKSQGILMSDDELSFVEYLAKYSGYTVENMQIALNELEYWTYIAEYEPEGKGPVVKAEKTEPVYDFSSPEVINQPEVMIATSRFVIYADVRNRYAATA